MQYRNKFLLSAILAGVLMSINGSVIAKIEALTYRIYIKNASSSELMISYNNAPPQKYPAKSNSYILYAQAFDIGHNKSHDLPMALAYPGGSCSFKIHVHSDDAGVDDIDVITSDSDCNDIFNISDVVGFVLGTLGDEPDVDKGSVVGDIEEGIKGASLQFVISDSDKKVSKDSFIIYN